MGDMAHEVSNEVYTWINDRINEHRMETEDLWMFTRKYEEYQEIRDLWNKLRGKIEALEELLKFIERGEQG